MKPEEPFKGDEMEKKKLEDAEIEVLEGYETKGQPDEPEDEPEEEPMETEEPEKAEEKEPVPIVEVPSKPEEEEEERAWPKPGRKVSAAPTEEEKQKQRKQKEPTPPPFAGFKLKKAKRVKRKIEEPTEIKVDLKHHEFEDIPQEEEPELTTDITLSKPEADIDVSESKKKKKKKTVKKKVSKANCVSSMSFSFIHFNVENAYFANMDHRTVLSILQACILE